MPLKPLRNNIIVSPTPPQSDNGGLIVFPESAGTATPVTGRVVSVSRGPASSEAVRVKTIARCRALLLSVGPVDVSRVIQDLLSTYQSSQESSSEVAVGDLVCFSPDAGYNITVDGEELIVIDEGDIQAVFNWNDEEAT